MDPRSVEASITAVLQLSAKVLGYLNDVEDTSKDHAKCAVETSNVHCLLLELRARLQGILLVEQHPYALWYTALRALGVENGPLDQFKQALEALQTIITDGDGLKQASKALMWRFKKEEVVGILQRIESFKKLVEIALKMNHFKLSQAIKDDTNFVQTHVPAIQSRVNKIRQDEADLKHGKMLDWISPTHYPAQQSVIMGHRQKGTSQWFLDAPEFARWLGEPRGTLFCPGIPGAGKTMVAAIAIDHLLESAQNSSVGVAYVYCNYKAQQEQDASSMLAAIVKQLVQSRPSAEEPVARLHSQHADRGTKPSLEEIFCTLREVVATYTTVYVVIDALDECRDGDGTRSQLLARLRDLQMGQDVRIMATARFMPEIEAEFQTAMRLEIQASDEDVRRFVAGQTHRLPKCIQRDPALQKMVEERTLERIDGMFLLARSRIDSLLDKQTPQRVKATLANFSKASTTLDHVNEMNLQRIMFESGRRGELARKVLSWIVLARRPITTAEICCALAVEPNEADLDPDNLPEIDDLVSVCVGMVKVDNGSGFIHLTHYTTQDYLERTQDMWFPDSETFITTICTAYLSFGVFKTGNCRSDEEFAERLHSYCLYDYAARYWGYHARNASTLSQVVMDFLQDKAKVEASSQAMLVDHASSSSNYSQQVPSQITGLHLSAYFGLDKAVVNLLNSGHQPNCKDSNGQTPLWWSAKKDHEAVTEVLCKKDTITLYLLIQEGENDLVKALLKAGYNVNSADFRRRTPLHNAVTSESVELATDLISAGADVNAKDMNEATPLRLAVKSKKLNMIKMLLEKSANTMDITTTEWRRTFESHTSDILKLTQKAGGGISLQLVPEELQSEVIQFAAKPRTERYLLQFVGDLPLLKWPLDPGQNLRPYDMHICSTEVDDQQWAYSVTASFPVESVQDEVHHPGDSKPNTVTISWNVIWDTNTDGSECWKPVGHFSTLSYVWIPHNGIDFFQHFVIHLEQRWLELCDKMHSNLSKSRGQVLHQKGSNPRQLDRLLEDGQRWIDLRCRLQDQVEKARRFAAEYCNRHHDIGALDTVLQRLVNFSDTVGQKISQLDDASKGLIQMEFNLVSINEARRSTSTSTSMKRLSWITFIFLPLIFISGLFGMNIDLLKSNPPWWSYVLFATVTILLTSAIWIIFKRNPNLEQSIEQKFGWLVSPRVVHDEEQGLPQGRHKTD